jgi:hypothetical protein
MKPTSTKGPLDIQDYLDATSTAAARTRWVTVVMMVTCMFVFAGLLNSLQSQWMGERIREIGRNPHGSYVQTNVGPTPTSRDPKDAAWVTYDQHVDAFYYHLVHAYIDNAFVIRVPVVGFTFDINDLGLIGGLAFVAIMVMLRFSLTREVDNVRESFDAATRMNVLSDFYTLLAMHQVFTVPHSNELRRTKFLVYLPKAVCGLPFLLQACVAGYDLYSSQLGFEVSWNRAFLMVVADFVALVLIGSLTPMAVKRLLTLDRIWQDAWQNVQATGRPIGAPGHAEQPDAMTAAAGM